VLTSKLTDALTSGTGGRLQRATPLAGTAMSGIAATAHAAPGVIVTIAVATIAIPEVFWLAALLFACWERWWILTHPSAVKDEQDRRDMLKRDQVAIVVQARAGVTKNKK
jgi:hypothetical protein